MTDHNGFEILPNFALDAIYHAASSLARTMALLRRGGPVPPDFETDIMITWGKLQEIIMFQEYAKKKRSMKATS